MLLHKQQVDMSHGLYGDLERIPFDRSYPQQVFPKILEMIGAMTASTRTNSSAAAPRDIAQASDAQLFEEAQTPGTAAEGKPTTRWEHLHGYISAVLNKKPEDASSIFEARLVELVQQDNQQEIPRWKADCLYFRHKFADESTLSELR